MVPFKKFFVESAGLNTFIANLNEILTGYYVNGGKWFSEEARQTVQQRKQQVGPVDFARADGQSKVMAAEFLKAASALGYHNVKNVYWTGSSPQSMTEIIGAPVDQRLNPSDVLVEFKRGPKLPKAAAEYERYLGLSAKSVKGQADPGLKNPGLGTINSYLVQHGLISKSQDLESTFKKLEQAGIKALEKRLNIKLPTSQSERANIIRPFRKNNIHSYNIVLEEGGKVITKLRDVYLAALKKSPIEERRQFISSEWLGSSISYPPYLRVTGYGNKPGNYTAKVVDPAADPKASALAKAKKIDFTPVGSGGIGVSADGTRLIVMRFKFADTAFTASMKLSGDHWSGKQ